MSTWFQSSPGPKAECYLTSPNSTRPPWSSFQSSPGPKAECYPIPTTTRQGLPCFNPHPARRPSATAAEPRGPRLRGQVSILTRPEGRVLRRGRGPARLAEHVSILTRPEGRVLRSTPHRCWAHSSRFQSSPGPKAECYRLFCMRWGGGVAGFNPHPARRPSAT